MRNAPPQAAGYSHQSNQTPSDLASAHRSPAKLKWTGVPGLPSGQEYQGISLECLLILLPIGKSDR